MTLYLHEHVGQNLPQSAQYPANFEKIAWPPKIQDMPAPQWVNLGTAVRVCSPCPTLNTAMAVVTNTTDCERFQPRYSHTTVRHITTKTLQL